MCVLIVTNFYKKLMHFGRVLGILVNIYIKGPSGRVERNIMPSFDVLKALNSGKTSLGITYKTRKIFSFRVS